MVGRASDRYATPAVDDHSWRKLPLDWLGDHEIFNAVVLHFQGSVLPLSVVTVYRTNLVCGMVGVVCAVVAVFAASSCLRPNSTETPPVSNAAALERSILRRVITD